MAALLFLIEGRSELAAVAAVVAVLVKPQGLVCLVIVLTVLVSRHMPRRPTKPHQDEVSPDRPNPIRLLTSVLAASAAVILIMLPFDLNSLASERWRGVPILGDVAGLIDQFVATGRLFSVLTANAYNLWALVGPNALVSTIGSGTAVWQPDTLRVLGVSAIVLGALMFGVVWLAVTVGLMRRADELAVLLGYTLLAVAFYTLPTRVHERYLFPAFASGAVLAVGSAVTIAAYLVASLANVINLHAVLAAPLAFVVAGGRGAPGLGNQSTNGAGPGTGGTGGPSAGLGGPGGLPSLGPGPPTGTGTPSGGNRPTSGALSSMMPSRITLPFSSFARSELVAIATVVAQTLVVIGLLAIWLVVIRQRSTELYPSGDVA